MTPPTPERDASDQPRHSRRTRIRFIPAPVRRRLTGRSLLLELVMRRHVHGLPILPDHRLTPEERLIAALLDSYALSRAVAGNSAVVVRFDEGVAHTVAECPTPEYAEGLKANLEAEEPELHLEVFKTS